MSKKSKATTVTVVAPEPRKPMRVSQAARFKVAPAAPAVPRNIFQPAEPTAGIPANATMANDRDIGSTAAWATAGDLYGEGLFFLGYPALSEMAQRPEYRRASEVIAEEMTRKWIRIHSSNDDDDNKADKVKAVEDAFSKHNIRDLFRRATEVDGFFGRANVFIDVGSRNNELPLVLSPRTIKQGGLKGFKLIEPVWTYPADYNSSDPLADDFYKPRSWYVMAQKIHASRMLVFAAREVPDLLKPAYSFGGLSISQMIKPYVDNWLRTRQSVSDLLHSFSVSGIKTNLSATMDGGDGSDIEGRAALFNASRDNRGLMMLDKETEDFFNITTPLTTLDALQAQSQEQMASVERVPLVKLLGIQPAGLNASSDGEIRTFYDTINAAQEREYRDPLTLVMQIIQLDLFGEIDPDIGFSFEPLWQLSEAEKATARKTDADTAAVYIEAGVIEPAEERQRLASQEDGMYPALDLSIVPEEPDVMENPDEADGVRDDVEA